MKIKIENLTKDSKLTICFGYKVEEKVELTKMITDLLKEILSVENESIFVTIEDQEVKVSYLSTKDRREYTNPPSNCDICSLKIKDIFYDGKTLRGYWANMCPRCYCDYGCGPDYVTSYRLREV